MSKCDLGNLPPPPPGRPLPYFGLGSWEGLGRSCVCYSGPEGWLCQPQSHRVCAAQWLSCPCGLDKVPDAPPPSQSWLQDCLSARGQPILTLSGKQACNSSLFWLQRQLVQMTATGSAPRGPEVPCPALQGHLGPLVPGPVQFCKVLVAMGAQGFIDLETLTCSTSGKKLVHSLCQREHRGPSE